MTVSNTYAYMVHAYGRASRPAPPCLASHLLLELAGGDGGEGQREEDEGVAEVGGQGQVQRGGVGARQQQEEELPRRPEPQQPWFVVGVD